jgi:hypothetical protein
MFLILSICSTSIKICLHPLICSVSFNVVSYSIADLIQLNKNDKLEGITNIKNLYLTKIELMQNYKIICDKIMKIIINPADIKFIKFRDYLYDILICNLNITDCVWYVLSTLINGNYINKDKISEIMVKTYTFFQYYNNNYRPIYHLESYFLYLSSVINKFS